MWVLVLAVVYFDFVCESLYGDGVKRIGFHERFLIMEVKLIEITEKIVEKLKKNV